MMKHLFKFTHIVAVAFAAVCMFGFTACNDEPYQHTDEKAAKLEEEIKQKTDSLQDQVDDLQSQIDALVAATCPCEIKTAADVAKIVNDSLKNYWNITQVQNFVNTQLDNYVLITTYQTMVDSLRGALNNINNHLKQHCDSIGQLYTDMATLNLAVTNAQATANAAKGLAERDSVRINNMNDSITAHRTIINQINNTVNNLAGRVTNLEGRLSNVADSAAQALALAQMDSVRLDALQVLYGQLHETDSVQQHQIDSIITVIDSLATKAEVREVKVYADTLYARAIRYSDSLHTIVMDTLNSFDARITTLETILPIVRDSVKLLNGKIDSLAIEIDTLKAQVLKNTQAIDRLTKKVDDVFSKTIFGLLTQGTYNPVFGYFALPVGIQSNVLMAYYGENDRPVEFPTTSAVNLVYTQYVLTADDKRMLEDCGVAVDQEILPTTQKLLGAGANAGKLFLTVNPSTADLTNATFTLENSIGEEAGIKLDSLRPSTEKLTFGYTGPVNRAGAVSGHEISGFNGFYEAEATLDEAGIPIAKVQINEELKQAVKNFYNNNIRNQGARQSVSNLLSPSNYTELARSLYQQFNGLMPRYAIKAHWTDSLGEHNVYSAYDIAAVAVRPLSYEFFYDKQHRLNKLPNITPISGLDSFKIDMSKIHFNVNFHIGYADTHIHLTPISINLTDSVDLYAVVEMPDMDTYDPNTGIYSNKTETIHVALDSLQGYLNRRFAQVTGYWNDSINKAIDTQVNSLIDEINGQVHDFAADIEGQLNTQIQNVVDDAKDQVMSKFSGYISKLNKVIGKINAAINRVNHLLDNPNKFLQTVLIYKGADHKFHLMSTTKSVPTVFNGTGAIMLYPTSYNAEIAAPAYKKFIAVTNVYKKGVPSAQEAYGVCHTELVRVNSKPYLGEVIEGGRYGISFQPMSGFTYEIFYSALDYSGRISQRKYYVTVK